MLFYKVLTSYNKDVIIAICVYVNGANMRNGNMNILKNREPIGIQIEMQEPCSSTNSDFGTIHHYW